MDGDVVRTAEIITAFGAVYGREPSRAELEAVRWVPAAAVLMPVALVRALELPR